MFCNHNTQSIIALVLWINFLLTTSLFSGASPFLSVLVLIPPAWLDVVVEYFSQKEVLCCILWVLCMPDHTLILSARFSHCSTDFWHWTHHAPFTSHHSLLLGWIASLCGCILIPPPPPKGEGRREGRKEGRIGAKERKREKKKD